MVKRYDLYLTCCPCCGHDSLIRWGYYQRRGKPFVDVIHIQRIRCKNCGRTTNVLPSFLLAYRSFAVIAVEQLVTTYLKQPENWQQELPLTIDLSTAYRWLRRLHNQANTGLPEIRTTLLKLKANFQLTQQFQPKPASMTSQRELLQRLVTLTQRLFKAVLCLAQPKTVLDTEVFSFLNYFLATHTGKALLQG